MLVATPGQTASYITLHNSSTNGGGNNNSTAATSTTKKTSTSSTTAGATKSLNNNNNHASSTITTTSSLNLNTNSTTNNYHSNTKNDNSVLNKLSNQSKSTSSSSREIISSTTKQALTTHSFKTENSTKTTSTTNNKQQSFIQTLKDSVQKALITTTGSSIKSVSTAVKHSNDNKLQNNCNNTKTSVNNVTSSSSSTSHNANKLSTIASSNNSTAVTLSASSAVSRGKYFSCSLSKLHTVAPTIIHRHPGERQHASSTDSLHKEMCHFKPIRIVPKTPWKSGSKSRGNNLRFPKANFATKKNEFVLKSNCDVNSRKKQQQQIDKIIIATDEDDDNEQENKEFLRIYKPKPSLTSLSTSFNTPNHTSAFVCLIADMKNLINLQSKIQLSSSLEEDSDDSIKELFSRQKQRPSKKQLQVQEIIKETPKTRGNRQPPRTATKAINMQTNAKKSNVSKVTAAVTKAKSSRNVGRAKSKTIDMVALAAAKTKNKLQNSASTPAVTASLRSKGKGKRKIAHDDNDYIHEDLISTLSTSPLPTKSNSIKSALLTARKSSRLSAMRMSVPANKRLTYSTNQSSSQSKTSSPKTYIKPTTVVSFSPIITRSRHKLLTEQCKIVEAVAVIKKRKT